VAGEAVATADVGVVVAEEGAGAAERASARLEEGLSGADEGSVRAAEGLSTVAEALSALSEGVSALAEGLSVVSEGLSGASEGLSGLSEALSGAAEALSVADVGVAGLKVGLAAGRMALVTPAMAAPDLADCLRRIKAALTESDRGLGERVGAARKTVGRWLQGRSLPPPQTIAELARIVHPIDATLALDVVRAHNALHDHETTSPFVVPETPFLPEPPLAQPALPGAPDANVIDAIVYAACDAADATPQVMRRALHAAFARADANGVSTATMANALAPPPPATRASTAKGLNTKRRREEGGD
jgi:hypothetical protein